MATMTTFWNGFVSFLQGGGEGESKAAAPPDESKAADDPEEVAEERKCLARLRRPCMDGESDATHVQGWGSTSLGKALTAEDAAWLSKRVPREIGYWKPLEALGHIAVPVREGKDVLGPCEPVIGTLKAMSWPELTALLAHRPPHSAPINSGDFPVNRYPILAHTGTAIVHSFPVGGRACPLVLKRSLDGVYDMMKEMVVQRMVATVCPRTPLALAVIDSADNARRRQNLMIMERLPEGGDTLHWFLKRFSASVADVHTCGSRRALRGLAASILDQFERMHRVGITHGDGHANNVWVTRGGATRAPVGTLFDFGRASPIGMAPEDVKARVVWREFTAPQRMDDLAAFMEGCGVASAPASDDASHTTRRVFMEEVREEVRPRLNDMEWEMLQLSCNHRAQIYATMQLMAPSHMVEFDDDGNMKEVGDGIRAPPAVQQYFLRTHLLSAVLACPTPKQFNSLFTFHNATSPTRVKRKVRVAVLNLEDPAALKAWYAEWFKSTLQVATEERPFTKLLNTAASNRAQRGSHYLQGVHHTPQPVNGAAASAWPPEASSALTTGPRTPEGSRRKFADGMPQEWWEGHWYRARPTDLARPPHRVAPRAEKT